jgi:NitT/TauT family transport system permease protein
MMPGSSSGLGYLIWYAYELLRADIIVAGMAAIGVIGFCMDRGFRHLEARLVWERNV